MEFSLKALLQFVAVAEEKSFTRAAARLHVAQPWLSTRVRQLEEIAGLRLLERTPHAVALTSDGEAFLKQARVVLAESKSLVTLARTLAVGDVGAVRVGAAPYTYFLPERNALLDG